MAPRSRTSSLDLVALAAGPLRLTFDPAQLWARHFKVGDVEVLRGVYPAIRDADWNTLSPRVRWVRRDIGSRAFALELRARCGQTRPALEWHFLVEGRDDGAVTLVARGTALRALQTNRTGFCVLHPAAAAGQRCQIEHTDGSREAARFPAEISPHQPFFDLRAISHVAAPGIRCDVRMEGDTFEMEDQRNWTDASFKTYCRPLAHPRPYTLQAGDVVEQRVVVHVSGVALRRAKSRRATTASCTLTLERRTHALPQLGFAFPAELPLSKKAPSTLRAAGIHRLRIELDLTARDWQRAWRRAVENLRQFGSNDSALHVALLTSGAAAELTAATQHINGAPAPGVVSWLVLDKKTGATTSRVFARVRRAWSRHRIPGTLGCGVRGDFVDFNRSRPIVPGAAFVSFGVDAQVHAFDEQSMLETVSTYDVAVAQARRIAGGAALIVAPVRFGAPRDGSGRPADPRQAGAFGGVWTLAALTALTRADADGAFFFQPATPRETPALRVFRAVSEIAPISSARILVSSATQRVCGLALTHARGIRVLVANFTHAPQRLRLAGLPAGKRTATLLFATGAPASHMLRLRGATLRLPACSVAQLDLLSTR